MSVCLIGPILLCNAVYIYIHNVTERQTDTLHFTTYSVWVLTTLSRKVQQDLEYLKKNYLKFHSIFDSFRVLAVEIFGSINDKNNIDILNIHARKYTSLKTSTVTISVFMYLPSPVSRSTKKNKIFVAIFFLEKKIFFLNKIKIKLSFRPLTFTIQTNYSCSHRLSFTYFIFFVKHCTTSYILREPFHFIIYGFFFSSTLRLKNAPIPYRD